jgi:hypothetical protein
MATPEMDGAGSSFVPRSLIFVLVDSVICSHTESYNKLLDGLK